MAVVLLTDLHVATMRPPAYGAIHNAAIALEGEMIVWVREA